MKALKSTETIQLRRDLALLLKRLRGIRRERLAASELRRRVNAALAEAGSLAQFVAVTPFAGDAQGCRFHVDKATVRAFEDGICGQPCGPQPAEAIQSCV
jgi:hypothetical protein